MAGRQSFQIANGGSIPTKPLHFRKRGQTVIAKGKYAEWITDDGLLRIEGWARAGLTDKQIVHNMGISLSTFYQWQIDYPELSEALKKGKKPVDDEVENALLKSALGFEYEEVVTEIIESPDGTQRKHIRRIKRYSPPSNTAQIFWLKNRRPDRWREKQDMNINAEPVKVVIDV